MSNDKKSYRRRATEGPEMSKIRISRRVLFFLSGTQAWQSIQLGYNTPLEEDLMKTIVAAPARKDGSVTVELPAGLAPVLRSYVEVMAIGARDNAGPDDPDSTADLNAARALLRQLDKAAA